MFPLPILRKRLSLTFARLCLTALVATLLVAACSWPAAEQAQPSPAPTTAPVADDSGDEAFRILHIMSYHAPWVWTDEQLEGFQEAFKDINVEYRIIQMDAKRNNNAESIEQISQEARDTIETWQPDLIYLNDDAAQEHIGTHYVNTDIPIVFSAVNADPATYDYAGSRNVTGVLEHEHFLPTMNLLLEMAPDVRRIAVVFDEDSTWEGVKARMQEQEDQLPEGVEIVRWDTFTTFADYQEAIATYQKEVDAVGLIGIFAFEDEEGNNVPFEEVLEWTAQHSQLPDFSFWESRIPYGTLCSVTVSGYEQGLAAGKIAYQILVDGVHPEDIAMEPTVRGEPVINLARAQQLGLNVDSSLLLSANVYEQFAWDEE